VLLPEGFELWPRVRPTLLRQLLGLGPEDHALFLGPDRAPIRVGPDQLLPLDAALIGRLTLEDAQVVEPSAPALAAGSVRNEKLGRFALWGFGGQAPIMGRDDERGPGQ